MFKHAALKMIAQASRRSHNDMGAIGKPRRSRLGSMPPTQERMRAPV